MPGPPKTPRKILEARGTARADRHGDGAKAVKMTSSELAEPPSILDEVGREKWYEVGRLLQASGLLMDADLGALCMYCEAWDELVWAIEKIRECGRISVSEKGGEYQHPAVGMKNKAIERIHKFGREFGMTPSSRTGLEVEAEQKTSRKGRFFKTVG